MYVLGLRSKDARSTYILRKSRRGVRLVHGMAERMALRRNESVAITEYIFLDCRGGSPVIEEHSGAAIDAPE
jgi:hypothetical protein